MFKTKSRVIAVENSWTYCFMNSNYILQHKYSSKFHVTPNQGLLAEVSGRISASGMTCRLLK